MKVPKIILTKNAVREIRSSVAEAKECESCGFLLGEQTNEDIYVMTTRPANNIYRSRTTFAISQDEYGAVIADVGPHRSFLGLYHSHHGSAHLSWLDRQNIALHSFVWLIVGLAENTQIEDWRCFKPTPKGIKRLPVSFSHFELLQHETRAPS